MNEWESWIEKNTQQITPQPIPSPKMDEWDAYIARIKLDVENPSSYDKLCELCVGTYRINVKDNSAEIKDMLHCFLEWWKEKKQYMNKYSSKSAIGRLVEKSHCTIIYYIGAGKEDGARKKTHNFEINTKDIADFLN